MGVQKMGSQKYMLLIIGGHVFIFADYLVPTDKKQVNFLSFHINGRMSVRLPLHPVVIYQKQVPRARTSMSCLFAPYFCPSQA